jgi:bifunctional DNase/RNase
MGSQAHGIRSRARVTLSGMGVLRARHFGILLLAALVAACACSRGPDHGADSLAAADGAEVRVHVQSVGFDRGARAHFVLLTDASGKRQLPVVIGEREAYAIGLAVHGIKPDRPLTQDLLSSIIEKTGNQVDRVAIVAMHHDTYYARIYMDHGRYSIDSRPSDAIALAVNSHAPIFVATKLFQEMPEPALAARGPRVANAIGMTVEELTPDLAEYFRVPAGQGAIVSDVGGTAQQAGVKRGDVILKVGGHPITGPNDFSSDLEKVKVGAPVEITLVRDGMPHIVTITR